MGFFLSISKCDKKCFVIYSYYFKKHHSLKTFLMLISFFNRNLFLLFSACHTNYISSNNFLDRSDFLTYDLKKKTIRKKLYMNKTHAVPTVEKAQRKKLKMLLV